MTKSKELEIRKYIFKLFVYNKYKYELDNSDHYALLDFICVDGVYKIEYINLVIKSAIKNNLSIKDFCISAKVYEIMYNLSREQLLNKTVINDDN